MPDDAESVVAAGPGSVGAPPAGLQAALGYTFKRPALLQQALVHRSYLHDVPDYARGSNERLEFLGDAVLGLIVARRLYLRHPDQQEGELTAQRGALVRLTRLAVWAGQVDLGAYLALSRGEEAQGGRTRASILGRAFEALLGAIYLDGGGVARRLQERVAAGGAGPVQGPAGLSPGRHDRPAPRAGVRRRGVGGRHVVGRGHGPQ
jgi:23S rRNA maturation mini-RNase III